MIEGEYQTVTILLSNGQEGQFTGKVLIRPEEREGLRVIGVAFSHPMKLPDGYEFEEHRNVPVAESEVGRGSQNLECGI